MSSLLNVLLVDDDPATQHLFETVLGYHDVKLATTVSEEGAVDYLKSNEPDVIILDIVLPGKDGYKVLKTIRNMPKAHCPIIATTAYYTSDSAPDFNQRGFDGYLLKPIQPEQLVKYLEEVVSNR
jgi:CheY-like chemotaxis protein